MTMLTEPLPTLSTNSSSVRNLALPDLLIIGFADLLIS